MGAGTAQFRSANVQGLTIQAGTVQVIPSGGRANSSRLSSLSISSGARLDLTDNKLIVAGGDVGSFSGGRYSGVTGLIAASYNAGAWTGSGITTSMPDAQPATGITTVAVATADETFYAGGTFGGVSVASGDVLVMYTYAGDLNLDGLVDAQDYGIIDNWVQFPGTFSYAKGDINYDGVIDAADYGIIDNTIQLQGPPIVTSTAPALATLTAVPEPVSLSALLLAAGTLVRRHRRARR
jgi:hypothetical protein